jgi:DNA replication protein
MRQLRSLTCERYSMAFTGFPEDNISQISIPDQFFRHILLKIDKLDELKLTLYIFWRLDRVEGSYPFIKFSDLLNDSHLTQSVVKEPSRARAVLGLALRRAVKRGTLLAADLENEQDKIICLNSPKGQAMIHAVQRGEWQPSTSTNQSAEIFPEHPNIFQLYEANIGPLTPLIADALRDAEKTYQEAWVEDAFRIAVEHNKRNWHYIDAILHRWQEGGRDDRKDQQDRRSDEKARRRYSDWEK